MTRLRRCLPCICRCAVRWPWPGQVSLLAVVLLSLLWKENYGNRDVSALLYLGQASRCRVKERSVLVLFSGCARELCPARQTPELTYCLLGRSLF